MKAAMGGSMLFYIVIFFTIAIILMFVSVLSFSKAYRVKDRVINDLETSSLTGENLKNFIDADLKDYGYKTTTKEIDCAKASKKGTCDSPFGTGIESDYKICICKHTDATNCGYYYEVITYTQFEFPIISDFMSLPVRGETRTMGVQYDKDDC